MTSAQPAKPTLEGIVTRYRREAARQDELTPELEVRLQDVDYGNFAAIYGALLAGKEAAGGKLDVGPPALTQMVSAIMDIHRGSWRQRGEGPARHLQPMRIREIIFDSGVKTKERFVYKEPLLLPVRFSAASPSASGNGGGGGGGLSYLVALSAERPEPHEFSSDDSAVIRVKARVSFTLTLAGTSELKPRLDWRIDMTVTRQITGSDARSSLPSIVGQMFRTTPGMTPERFLAVLRLDDDANPAPRELYRYEVEAEFVGPAEVRDMLRPADVTGVADTILRLANPEHAREAALAAEVYRVARYLVQAPAYLQQFRHALGLKRLLPQAQAITRADYRKIYPPKGMYLTDKADGKRAVALVHDGRGFVAADSLLEYPPMPPAPAGKAGKPALDPKYVADTIVDGELILGPGEKAAFYAFDVIAVAGEDLSRDGFEKRVGRLGDAVAILRAAGIGAEAKPYTHLVEDSPRELERVVRGVYEAKRPYTTDGLIFVQTGAPYDETQNYKWKSARDNTIDFLARRVPASVLGREPFVDRPGHKVHFLFVGIRPALYQALGLTPCPGYADLFGATGPVARGERMDANTGSYFPIQFSPSDVPLAYVYQHPDASPLGEVDGKVIEGRCAGPCAAAGGEGPPRRLGHGPRARGPPPRAPVEAVLRQRLLLRRARLAQLRRPLPRRAAVGGAGARLLPPRQDGGLQGADGRRELHEGAAHRDAEARVVGP